MKLQGEYVFDGSRAEVWELVRDPEVLAAVLPGTQSMEKISDSEYKGQMHVRIGPVSGVFAGRVLVSNEVAPESYTLTVEGKGAAGFGNGSGDVQLVDQGDGTTLMKYDGELQVGGKLAGVGQRMVETVSNSMIRRGLESLSKALQARLAAKSEGKGQVEDGAKVEKVEYKPPSEAEFAAAVAKDVAGDLFASAAEFLTPENQTALVVAFAALVGVVIGFFLGRRSRR